MSQNSRPPEPTKPKLVSEMAPAAVKRKSDKVNDTVDPPKTLDLAAVRLQVVQVRKFAENGETVKALAAKSFLYASVLRAQAKGEADFDIDGISRAALEADKITLGNLPVR